MVNSHKHSPGASHDKRHQGDEGENGKDVVLRPCVHCCGVARHIALLRSTVKKPLESRARQRYVPGRSAGGQYPLGDDSEKGEVILPSGQGVG